MVRRQGRPAAAAGTNNPPEVGAATLTARLLATFEAAKNTGTRQQAAEQPVNFKQHDKLTVIA
jgi:predicted component of type VI protein secretion system